MPTDHPPARAKSVATMLRRDFLGAFGVVLSGCAALIVTIPSLAFLVEPLFRRSPRVWRSVGALDRFEIGKTVEVTFEDASPVSWAGVTARTAAWLRRDGPQQFTAFTVNCAHLGCPVRWLPDANLFMCPCHGGVYDADGRVAAGPPPRPLARYPVRIRNSEVEIQTSPLPIG